ncbi:MAG: hypothetical protein KKE20_01715 [Nanoarchaeota archaeon]|nr:hypothetical protein [Nanoarchaeota archaeon]
MTSRLAKAMLACIMLGIILILMTSGVSALGVSPARTAIDFVPGQMEKVSFNIINNENKDVRMMITAEGELSEYVDIGTKIIEMKAGESIKEVQMNIIQPWKIDKAGTNSISIKILELPQEVDSEQKKTKVDATLEIIHQIKIEVPFPGRYLEVPDVYITTSQDGETVLFTIPLENKGKEDLSSIKAMIEIYGPAGDILGVIETTSADLKRGSEGKIEGKFNTEGRRGRYDAKIVILYGDEKKEIKKGFFIGSEYIDIVGLSVDKFTLGSIAKFNILAENKWNQKIRDVYAEIYIMDNKGQQVAKSKTSSIDIEAEQVGMFDAYWDTENINPGMYSMQTVLYYGNLATKRLFEMDVGFDSIKIRGGTGAVVGKIEGKGSSPLMAVLLGILVINILIVNIVIIKFLRSRKKKQNESFRENRNEIEKDNTLK